MKLRIYSDLHLEFAPHFSVPSDADADVLILAGDIITFRDFNPLLFLLKDWKKPVLYIAGNHEYYSTPPMAQARENLKSWLADPVFNLSNVTFLQDESITIDGVHFFAGTMWTDFRNSSMGSMRYAWQRMNDYNAIRTGKGHLTPKDTVEFHKQFKTNLLEWFEKKQKGPHVVISHHAPIKHKDTRYGDSLLQPAYNSLDMIPIIEKYKPVLWVYGHTHEPDDQIVGSTRIVSNPFGYHRYDECTDFCAQGKLIEIESHAIAA